MAKQRGDTDTLSLLDWQPPEPERLVERYPEPQVRAGTLRGRIAKAVSETLRHAEQSREDIAAAMSDWLGEDVTKNMLDAYASQSREDHTIPYLRLLALTHVTGDTRLLQLGAELFGRAVIEERWLDWVRVGQMSVARESFNKEFNAALHEAKRKAGVKT